MQGCRTSADCQPPQPSVRPALQVVAPPPAARRPCAACAACRPTASAAPRSPRGSLIGREHAQEASLPAGAAGFESLPRRLELTAPSPPSACLTMRSCATRVIWAEHVHAGCLGSAAIRTMAGPAHGMRGAAPCTSTLAGLGASRQASAAAPIRHRRRRLRLHLLHTQRVCGVGVRHNLRVWSRGHSGQGGVALPCCPVTLVAALVLPAPERAPARTLYGWLAWLSRLGGSSCGAGGREAPFRAGVPACLRGEAALEPASRSASSQQAAAAALHAPAPAGARRWRCVRRCRLGTSRPCRRWLPECGSAAPDLGGGEEACAQAGREGGW